MWDCLQEAGCGHCLKVASALLAVILVYLAVRRQRARAREEFLRARWNSFGEVRKLLRTTQNLLYIFHSFVEFLAVNSQKSTVQSCLFAANLLVVCLRKCHCDIFKLWIGLNFFNKDAVFYRMLWSSTQPDDAGTAWAPPPSP